MDAHPVTPGMRSGATALAFAAVFLVLLGYPLNQDTSWYLIATRSWLDGATLYTDIMEINPPLAFYMTVPALGLADMTGLDATRSMLTLTMSAALFSSLWTMRIMGRGGVRLDTVAVVLVAATFVLLPLRFVGQREHLMLILATPYLASLCVPAPDATGRAERIVLGLLGGLGLALKPYFLLAPVLVSLTILAQKRQLRAALCAQNLAAATVCLGYPLFVAWRHPEYFTELLPLGRAAYASVTDSYFVVFRRAVPLFCLASVPLVICRLMRLASGDIARWAAAACGFLAAFAVQGKGWDYHLLPFASFAVLMTIPVIAALRDAPTPTFRRVVLFCAGAVVVAVAAGGPYRTKFLDELEPVAAAVEPGDTILTLSSHVWTGFPLTNTAEAGWASRYPHQWPIPGPYVRLRTGACQDAAACEVDRAILRRVRREVVDDWIEARPALVIVDMGKRKGYFGSVPFDYFDFLDADERFGDLIAGYAYDGIRAGHAVWVRRPEDGLTAAGNTQKRDRR